MPTLPARAQARLAADSAGTARCWWNKAAGPRAALWVKDAQARSKG
ncbi:hypothetical protein IM543_15445 [Massilia sp. UMI-21]|nr:hypothetical protein IM543_15445 [Massilia sp. UMI-21]